jgi:hypothetical protein
MLNFYYAVAARSGLNPLKQGLQIPQSFNSRPPAPSLFESGRPPYRTSIRAAPAGLRSDPAQCGIVKSRRRAFLVIDRSKQSVHTKDARDSGLLVLRYYGYLIVDLYHDSRSHLSLDKDAPATRQIQRNKSERIVTIAQVGGLHHRYERLAA